MQTFERLPQRIIILKLSDLTPPRVLELENSVFILTIMRPLQTPVAIFLISASKRIVRQNFPKK